MTKRYDTYLGAYCSKECCEAGQAICPSAIEKGGMCRFCGAPVLPFSGYAIPHRDGVSFSCFSCVEKAKSWALSLPECAVCGKQLELASGCPERCPKCKCLSIRYLRPWKYYAAFAFPLILTVGPYMCFLMAAVLAGSRSFGSGSIVPMLFAGGCIYGALWLLLMRPLMRLTAGMVACLPGRFVRVCKTCDYSKVLSEEECGGLRFSALFGWLMPVVAALLYLEKGHVWVHASNAPGPWQLMFEAYVVSLFTSLIGTTVDFFLFRSLLSHQKELR